MILVHRAINISDAPFTSILYLPLANLVTTAIHFRAESNGTISTTSPFALSSLTDPIPMYSCAKLSNDVSVLDPMYTTLPFSSLSNAVEFSTIESLIKFLVSSERVETTSAEDMSESAVGESGVILPFVLLVGPPRARLSPNREVVPMVPATTLILFSVSVPDLSEQTVVAFPIVSHARNKRTRLLSLSILVVANANASVTASGNPSGTATTTIVTATMKTCKNAWPFAREPDISCSRARNSMKETMKRSKPAARPSLAMYSARTFNFDCNGVVWPSSCKDIRVLP